MPINKCTLNGKDVYKYGDTGTCYTGPDGKQKAINQAIAINSGTFPANENLSLIRGIYKLSSGKIGFDFDGTVSTQRGQNLFKSLNGEKYVITARSTPSNDVYKVTDLLGVPRSRVFFTGSNQNKVEKIKELGIDVFYDNNSDVHQMLPSIVRLF